jgi:tetratricopeptide (TPR) repeat protein/predicted Ser/Thr protein kinase
MLPWADMSCPSAASLREFLEAPPSEGNDPIRAHVESCVECRERVLALPSEADADGAEVIPPDTLIGRYRVLRFLGRGGMGTVYAAHDPELDRTVAVKVLRRQTSRDEAELRKGLKREAQALARLSHAHVVTVHDIGTSEHGVFIAMELIEGTTLRAWLLEPRAWHSIVDAFVRAGRGLEAAHRAGLIHRDFKPENVLVGNDGRVCVTDFGLARVVGGSPGALVPRHFAESVTITMTRSGTLVGTPAFMPPEQLTGGAVDERTDLFSFCLALWEAVYGKRPFAGDNLGSRLAAMRADRVQAPPQGRNVPGWLRPILLRGLRADPAARFQSMAALLAALSRDKNAARRRTIAVSALFAVGIALPLGYRQLKRAPVCRGAEQKLVGVWDDARKRAVHAAFLATGEAYAEDAFAGVARTLDAFARGWTTLHTEACEATRVRKEQSEELLDLRMECLAQHLQEANAQIDVLVHADAKIVEKAAAMTGSLTSLAGCSDAAALRAPVRPPAGAATRARVAAIRATLARAKALSDAGKYAEGIAIVRPVLTEARALAYRPLEARALLRLGVMQLQSNDAAADQTFEAAALAAAAGRDVSAQVEAWTDRGWAAEQRDRIDQARSDGQYGLALLEGLGSTDEEGRARLFEMLGALSGDEAKYDEALQYARRALAIRERMDGPNSIGVAHVLVEMGRNLDGQGRYAEAETAARRGYSIYERQVGPAHLDTLFARAILGYALQGQRRYDEALDLYRRSLAALEAKGGQATAMLPEVLIAMSETLVHKRAYDEAQTYARRALEVSEKTYGPWHADVAAALMPLGDALRGQAQYAQALAQHRRALAVFEKSGGATSPFVATALVGIGLTELDLHAPREAVPLLERALATLQKQPGEPTGRGEARFALARALWEGGRDRGRARALASEARSDYTSAEAKDEKHLAEIDGWLDAHR